MIDSNLVEKNSAQMIKSMMKSVEYNRGLRTVKDVFTSEMMSKIQEYLLATDRSLWQSETTASYQSMTSTPRLKIAWHSETVIEELHMVFESVTETINKLYPGSVRKFMGITVWQDSHGYNINWHTDNEVIDISMQVYLQGYNQCPGTEFRLSAENILVPWDINTGYISSNHPSLRNPHRIQHPVSGQEPRYSVFAIWTALSE